MKYRDKKAMASQTLFAILMLVLFVGILMYGYNSLITIQTTLNDEELDLIEQQILQKTSVCIQQSQKGRFETYEIRMDEISHICYLKDKSILDSSVVTELENRGISEDSTIILLNGPKDVDFNGYSPSDMARVDEFIIYDIIPLENGVTLSNPNNGCQVREDSLLEFKFQC